ncbi:MAG: hypothetical protein B7Z37_16925 [Verrucomicrobia bacterium 12-59-8]|nr:MAG: hypothetical protein B7Z37_16925 [Verrucomicrobia bacterium 12-59-8]
MIFNPFTGQLDSTGGAVPPSALAFAPTLTINAPSERFHRIPLTGDMALAAPTSGADGVRVRLWLVASGGARTVTLDAAIVIPTTSTLTSPFTVASGTKTKLLLEYDASRSAWEVASYIAGY